MGDKMKKNSENEEKKEYLRSYRNCIKAVKRIEGYLQELEINEICPSLSMNGMPAAVTYNNRDLSDYVVKKDKLISDMLRARYQRITTYKEVIGQIELLSDEDEKNVLMYRYIKGMQWEDVAAKLNVEWAQIHRIHARALQHFNIPDKDDIE